MPRQEEADSYLDEWRSLWEPDLEAIAFNGTTCDPTRVDPKVLQWAKHNCSRKPHFIKIINRGAANGQPGLHSMNAACQLGVPGPFVKQHFRELERVVTLENEGNTWKVSFGDARTYPHWRQGWKRVAIDNDLKPGEVMIFVLVANSRFRFTRFDEDGNILSEKRTNYTLNDIAAVQKVVTTHSVSQGHEKPGSATNPEDLLHRRTSWKLKRAAALASRISHCTETECVAQPKASAFEFDGHDLEGPSQLIAPLEKQIAEAPFKRIRLRKVGEIMSKANSNDESNQATNNEHPHDSAEAGSTSMADSPSTVTIASFHPPQEHMSGNF